MVKIPKSKESKKDRKRTLKEKRRDKKLKRIQSFERAKQEELKIFKEAS